LERIDKAIKTDETATLLSSNAIEAISKSIVSESLCPDMEYSTSETGNRRRSIEILFAFSAPRRKTLYTMKTISMSHKEKRAFRNLRSPINTNGTVTYNDRGG
jgi:DNA integrity scanning protein DisA with diadenylate cyclase activity